MSRKRARRSNAHSIVASDDAPVLKGKQNLALQLPTELIYTILAISMGDYLGDMMLYPSKVQKWDAILTFLHVSRTFRGCTIDLLYYLWGDTFIHERTSVVRNYKPTYSIFRRLSRQARSAPLTFISRNAKPKLLSARVVRHPISPLARIWSALIRNTATANAVLLDAENDRVHVDFSDVYVGEDLQVIMDSYAEIPAGIRPLLLGRVMHQVMTQAAIWTKRESPAIVAPACVAWGAVLYAPPPVHSGYLKISPFTVKALSSTVASVLRLLTLLLETGGQLEINAELPQITEDSVAQVSRDKHASLADIYSLAVEDIPPMLAIHVTAVGLDIALFLLKFVEGEGNVYGELCQMMRSYIASYLTDTERARYMR
ncbi:hypothetical protein BJV78DRAFT_1388884 [Lactifluus subvellereus]|nr:hypothetical protein BJV78DRAFT_1388884 [Lactifluus subvellereus]